MKNYLLDIGRLLGLLTFVCFALTVEGSLDVKHHHLTVQDGLPDNNIVSMVQDGEGYLWLGTNSGLVRYDGYTFLNYTHEEQGKEEFLMSNRCKGLIMNGNGLLLIQHPNDVYSIFDTGRQCFLDFQSGLAKGKKYKSCYIAGNNDTWLYYRHSGCLRLRYRDGEAEATAFSVDNGAIDDNLINFVSEDVSGNVWISTARSLYLLRDDKPVRMLRENAHLTVCVDGRQYFITNQNKIYEQDGGGGLKQVFRPSGSAQLPLPIAVVPMKQKMLLVSKEATYEFCTKTRRMELSSIQSPGAKVGRDNTGNYYVAGRDGQFWYYDCKRDEWQYLNLSQYGVTNHFAYTIQVAVDRHQYLWISTNHNGLFLYDPANQQLQHYVASPNEASPLLTNRVNGIFADVSGNIWVSQENMGITCMQTLPRSIQRLYLSDSRVPDYENNIRMVRRLSDGELWAGNKQGGLYRLTVEGSQLQVHRVETGTSDDCLCVLRDSDGELWMGFKNDGLKIGNTFYTHTKDAYSLSSQKVTDLLLDRKGRVWVAAREGGIDLAQRRPDGTYGFRHFGWSTIEEKSITMLYETREGNIVAGCSDGFIIFDPEKLMRNPKAYFHYNQLNGLRGIFEMKDVWQTVDGTLWFASEGSGVYKTLNNDIANLKLQNYTTKDGLSSNNVISVTTDRKDRLWFGTDNGLNMLDAKSGQMKTYFLAATYIGNVFSENSAERVKGKEDMLLFGTLGGLVAFNPEMLIASDKPRQAACVTGIDVNGARVDADPQPSGEGWMLTLSHRQNSLTFRFSDFLYEYPSHTEYQYMLEGHDRAWSQPSTSHLAIYQDLKPGNYTFRVKLAGTEDSTASQVTVRISQPWWNTWWAWALYLLLLAAVGYYIFRLLSNNLRLRQQMKLDNQVNEFKQKFFMDVSHEFRTPLTLIRGSMDKLRQQSELPAAIKQPLSNMNRSAERLLRLINELMEFHKIQNNQLQLHLQETDVVGFVRDIVMSFRDLTDERGINLQFMPFKQKYMMYTDQGYLDKIVYNLVSNAVKYTPRKGDIDIRMKQDGDRMVISVADTGVGVSEEKRDKLFTRFLQSNLNVDTMGIGLNFTEQLVLAMHGTIGYQPNEPQGSVFTFELPTDIDVYRKEDFMVVNEELETEQNNDQPWLNNYKEMPPIPLNRRTVLIVEDDEDVRQYLKSEMMQYFEVELAENGMVAMDMLKANLGEDRFSLIISDIKMPQMDGMELLKTVRGDDALFDIPFILLTAMSNEQKELQGFRFGADAYMPKPFSLPLLVTRSIALIEQREKIAANYRSPSNVEGTVGSMPVASSGGQENQPLLSSQRDRKFLEILDLKIESLLATPSFSVDELARSMNFGRSQFYRRVSQVTGTSPNEYIREKRMMRAKALLEDETITVAEVAYKVGFSDPLYFSRCFKQRFGLTPSKYQKS